MHSLKRVKQEEGLLRALFHVTVEELKALLQEHHVHLFVIEIRCNETRATVKGPFVRGQP